MITSPKGSIYIGQSCDIHVRWKCHRLSMKKKKSKLISSFKKYGIDNHIFDIIEECEIDKLNDREAHYIKFFNTFDTSHGFNLTTGGDMCKMSEESRDKIRQHHNNDENYGMKNKKHNDETKKKMSESASGENNHRYGTIASKETRKKMSECRTGENHHFYGKRHTEEAKSKIREKRKLQVSPMKGKKQTEEHIAKIVATRRKNGSYKVSEDNKIKISLFHKGRKRSKTTGIKISQALSGRKFSEQRKQALRNGWAKRREKLKLLAE